MSDSASYPRFRWLVLIAAVIGYVTLQVTNLAMAPVLPQIAASLNINLGTASNLVMTTFLFSGCIILVLVGGVICDRYGVLVSIVVGVLCAAVPASLMPWLGHSTRGILWARIVEGFSPGFLFPAMSPIISMWFPDRQKGLAGGLMSASVAVGSAGGVILGPAVFALVKNWQVMCAWLSLVGWAGFVFTAILALMPKPQLPAQAAPAASGASDGGIFKSALLSPLTLCGVLVTFMACYGMQCLYSLTSTFLAADKPVGAGYGSMAAGQLMLGVTLFAGVIGPIVCGLLLDKVFKGNAKAVFLIGYALMCVFVYLLKVPLVTGQVPLLEVALILAGFGVQFVMPTIYYFIARAYAPQLAGKMSGIWTGIGNLGGVVGLYIAGVTVKSQNSYHTTLTLQALAALLGFCLVFFLAAATKKPARSAQTAGAAG
jgi:MFS family permease